jgi:hypothetical protein
MYYSSANNDASEFTSLFSKLFNNQNRINKLSLGRQLHLQILISENLANVLTFLSFVCSSSHTHVNF